MAGFSKLALVALGVGACVVALGGCGLWTSVAPPFRGGTVNRNASDVYRLVSDTGDTLSVTPTHPGAVEVSAPNTNSGGGSRAVFYDASQSISQNQQSCATVVKKYNPTPPSNGLFAMQPGIALRIVVNSTTNLARAVTLTQNIFTTDLNVPEQTVFNIHGMDGSTSNVYTQYGSDDFALALNGSGDTHIRLPYTMCLRAVGNTVTAKVWYPNKMPEPAWNNPTFTFCVTLPSAWTYAGKAGYFAAHLQPADVLGFADMASLPNTWDPPTITTLSAATTVQVPAAVKPATTTTPSPSATASPKRTP